MGQRGLKPQCATSIIWSPELAYAVGLITTDGCLSGDGRHIDFTSKDKSLVHTFKKCLNLKNRIGRKVSGYTGRKDYYRVQFGDVNFYNWLLDIGLSPHKSKILKELKIPNLYFFDFLRGCFDGDGSIHAFWDPRWQSSYMYYIQFASASYAYLEWMQKRIHKLSGAFGRIQPVTRSYQLTFAKRGTRVISARMFYHAGIPLSLIHI